MICDISFYSTYHSIHNTYITLPNNLKVLATHVGTVHLHDSVILHDVLFVPSFTFNLISVHKLTSSLPISVLFLGNVCYLQDLASGKRIGSASLHNGLYCLTFPSFSTSPLPTQPTALYSQTDPPGSFDLWHYRLGHLSHSKIPSLQLFHSGITTKPLQPCAICHFAKQRKLPFHLSSSISTAIFDLVHIDTWGPNSQPSYDGFSYFLTIVDDYSRVTWVMLMKNKSDAKQHIQSFCAYAAKQFGKHVKRIRSDNAREFLLTDFYQKEGIVHETSCVETPQQNSRVERKHQHILSVARALKFQANLPLSFWSDCVRHAVFLINRLPSPVLDDQTPYQLLHDKPPDLSFLRVFGSLVYASTLVSHRIKFTSRARECIFLGYSLGTKGFKLYDLHSHDVFVSRDVVFYEHVFPYKLLPSPDSDLGRPQATLNPSSFLCPDIPLPSASLHPPISSPVDEIEPSSPTAHHPTSPNTSISPIPSFPDTTSSPTSATSPDQLTDQLPDMSPSSNDSPQPLQQTDHPRRTNRTRKLPSYLTDYHLSMLSQQEKAATNLSSIPLEQGSTHQQGMHPLSKVVSYNALHPKFRQFCLSVSSFSEPKTFREACKQENWIKAMTTELNALEQNQTWRLEHLPTGKQPIGCKWVYRVKVKSDGSIERYKARLVAKGYTQQEGLDYTETFAPVVKMTTIRVLLAISASRNWHIEQLDVNNAFLHEEVYMEPPPGLIISPNDEGKVCRLTKSLYGLKQASRQWFAKLTEALITIGYRQSNADYSLFTKGSGNDFTVILIYVDDLILAGSSMQEISAVKTYLDKAFQIKDLGALRYFLGLEVARSSTGIHLN
ncbi:Retrovirus-related Pol polyprotein from transposon TNT 1-94 [Linum perenne]